MREAAILLLGQPPLPERRIVALVSTDRDGQDDATREAPPIWIAPEARARAAHSGWLRALEASGTLDRSDAPGPDAFRLGYADGVFDLRPPEASDRLGIRAVLPPDAAGGAKRNPLLRAIGSRVERVIDATAGLGGDACRIAQAGLPVVACERDPVVFALLSSGFAAACASGALDAATAARMTLVHADGAEAIDEIDALDVAVYVDPMYPPPRRASAKPRRALQVLRAWLGHGAGRALDEATEWVGRARARAARVVVKRPHHATPLAGTPDFVIESKLVRFDVYANPARMRSAGAAEGSAGAAEGDASAAEGDVRDAGDRR